MTIKELYEWAVKNKAEDYDIVWCIRQEPELSDDVQIELSPQDADHEAHIVLL